MLKALIRKQFMEVFKGYFVNRKTGKKRSKGNTILYFLLFGLLMLVLCGFFFGLSYLLAEPLFGARMEWLYYTLMGLASVGMGVFGSVFNTYAGLYLAKDNELLISMPIPPRTILASRLLSVYGLSLLYSGTVWLPAVICGWIMKAPAPTAVIFSVLLTFFIALFVSVLTCLLGWLVALIVGRMKNKSFFTVILSLCFFAAYYAVCFQMESIASTIMKNVSKVGTAVKSWLNLTSQLGPAAQGDVPAMLIYCGVTALLSLLCFWVMSRTFLHIAIGGRVGKKNVYSEKAVRTKSVRIALLHRELKRFTASALYMMNTALGIVILPALSILALVKLNSLQMVLNGARLYVPEITQMLPMLPILAAGLVVGMDGISTPSISLEGKNLWILKTLPVKPAQILEAKIGLHVAINLLPTLASVAILSYCLRLQLTETLLVLTIIGLYVWLTGTIGLIIGLLRPNLHWTSEQTVIKQSLNVLLSWLANVLILAVMGGCVYLLRNMMSVQLCMGLIILLEGIAQLLLNHWIQTGGARRFMLL